jgi:hypothetical protein
LMSALPDMSISTPAWFGAICLENLFLSFHFKPMIVFAIEGQQMAGSCS